MIILEEYSDHGAISCCGIVCVCVGASVGMQGAWQY